MSAFSNEHNPTIQCHSEEDGLHFESGSSQGYFFVFSQ